MTERRENLILGLLFALGLILIAVGYFSAAEAFPKLENPSDIARCR